MIFQRLSMLAMALACSVTVTAEESGEQREVFYTGNAMAREVCRAVVTDDPDKLHRLLRATKMNTVYGYTFDTVSPEISGSYFCNDMDLHEFSQNIGAENVYGYLVSGGNRQRGEAISANP